MKGNLVTLLGEYRGERGKESFDRKIRFTIYRPTGNPVDRGLDYHRYG